ncbi:MAG: DinB family protein [Chloroflexota bacterium]
MNSYQRALDTLSATPSMLTAIVTSAPNDALSLRPSPEEWSVQEVIAHLLHVETAVIAPRIRQMLEHDDPILDSAGPPEKAGDLTAALEAWRKARADNLAFLRPLSSTQQQRTGRHSKYGRISVEEHVVELAYHDLDHLRQILKAIQAEIYGEIGVFQALYPRPF